ncbi:hypothetical protein EJ08DRAFT_685109 [Tothia fuscella]|uniref:Carbohydrate kinase PfkB domain-containing protein n=1 Tax=Tothia fuscella TaxID=1048955 RepID=A0A9P4P2Z4_9PEZI|nr:hypothetical protein EJ08DRAFT_685109 [Tothia fuscella]
MFVRSITRSRWKLGGNIPGTRPLIGQKCSISTNTSFLKISDEVREAINTGKPVVALESTIYTHGYPYPQNVALASELESIVRIHGGVPATIGIFDGVARVGLDPEELIRLAASAGKDTTLKLSRRDLSYVLGLRLTGKTFHGGTTIAGTMILAHLAGIKVFATGGLGGVHRGAESTMDISADLTELGRTPVAVISSGCKSFLDIPRTLEYLETEGTSVATFADGRPGMVDFPAFWSRDSGVRSPLTIQDEKEAAAITYAHTNLPLTSGLLFANPIPSEASIPKNEMDTFIEDAIKQADAAGITGKDNTPFILNKIKELSGGKSLSANRALILSNVRRGTIVARELAHFESNHGSVNGNTNTYTSSISPTPLPTTSPVASALEATSSKDSAILSADIVVAGALAVDYSCDFTPFPGQDSNQPPQLHTSNPSTISQSIGGVAHNVAKAAYYCGSDVLLQSAIGDDLSGHVALQQLAAEGMQVSGIKTLPSITGARTAQYVAMNDSKKDLFVAMADMGILEKADELLPVWTQQILAARPKWFLADANWDAGNLHKWFKDAKNAGAHTAFEPVSTAKSTRLFTAPDVEVPVFPNHIVDITTPNICELGSMHAAARNAGLLERQDWWTVVDALGIPSFGARTRFQDVATRKLTDQGIPQQSVQLLPFIPCVLTKLGPQGVLLTMLLRKGDSRLTSSEALPYIIARTGIEDNLHDVGGVYMRLFPPAEVVSEKDIASVNGVGDTFLGALVSQLAKGDIPVEKAVDFAQEAAVLTLKSRESVGPEIRALKMK